MPPSGKVFRAQAKVNRTTTLVNWPFFKFSLNFKSARNSVCLLSQKRTTRVQKFHQPLKSWLYVPKTLSQGWKILISIQTINKKQPFKLGQTIWLKKFLRPSLLANFLSKHFLHHWRSIPKTLPILLYILQEIIHQLSFL